MASRYVVEHLNHLGIVAEVCREIGVAAWLDEHDPTSRQPTRRARDCGREHGERDRDEPRFSGIKTGSRAQFNRAGCLRGAGELRRLL